MELPTDIAQTAALLAELEREHDEDKLGAYKPYDRQRSFHAAGATHRERLLIAANQSGKTLAGAMEVAMHATGRYPDWWQGRRFNKPTISWVAGTTGETVRDAVQRMLVGRPGAHGTGAIPKDAIIELVPARGIPDLLDSIRVRHAAGGISIIGIKSYLRGCESFQGETLDFAWLDEECPPDVYTEMLTRTNVSSGPVMLTFTPLLGMTEVVRRFLLEPSPDRSVTTMTLDDVQHYTAAEKEAIAASYAPHEREARTKGVPVLGSGRVFPVSEEMITVEHREFPSHWPRIGGLDFGWDHPFGAVELVHDRDADVVYVSRTYRARQTSVIAQCSALRAWGRDLRWVWPADGRQETLAGAGNPLAEQYRREGLDLWLDHATFEDGGVSVEAGIAEMLTRMETGRLKVFKYLRDWLDEFAMYHRKDGKVIKEHDDLLCATRYGIMMLRFARTAQEYDAFRRPIEYPRLGIV
jgi:phage terminase large subunit-like protein